MGLLTAYFSLMGVSDATYKRIDCNLSALSMDANNVQKLPAVFTLVDTYGATVGTFAAYLRLQIMNSEAVLDTISYNSLQSSLTYTLPADKYGIATGIRLTAYEDKEFTKEICHTSVSIVRENPTPFPRSEDWSADLTYKNGEYLMQDNIVYMWTNPIAGNSTVDPKTDIQQHPDTTSWKSYQEWPLLASQVFLAKWAKLGSSIFDGDYTFSQHGKDAGGNDTGDYRQFDPTKIGQSDCPFTPNLMIDWLLGKLIGLDMDIRGGKVGSLRIDGNTLSTEDTKTGILIKAGSGKDYTGKRLELGGDGSAVVNIEMRPVTDEHEQLKLANGIVITNYGSGNKCIHILANGDGSIAIESYGGCRMVQRRGEIWDVPGVLWSARMSTTGKSAYWGDGCKITNVEKIATGKYRFYHDLGHDEYSVQATAIWVNWEVATVLDHTDTYFTIGLFHKDQGFLDGMYYVTVIGRNKVRT